MADIQLRFHNDMLVLSTPIAAQLERIGIDAERDNEITLLLEPEVLHEAYALEAAAGAQCIVADTAFMTPARLAHSRMVTSAPELAARAIEVATEQNPQHVLVEIAPCELPLDASSKASLNESRDQYARAASAFAELEPMFDAYFLNGFTSCVDLKCALMGMRKVTDKPIFASVDLARGAEDGASDVSVAGEGAPDAGDDAATPGTVAATPAAAAATPAAAAPAQLTLGGKGRETLAQAVAVMSEYGAQVAGFQTSEAPDVAAQLVGESVAATTLPILVQMRVRDVNPEQAAATPENPYYEPDAMIDAADQLKAAGAQFLRACGNATPSYAGALVAATIGDDVLRPDVVAHAEFAPSEDPSELAERLRSRIKSALDN